MKKPFLNALAAAVYIAALVLIGQVVIGALKDHHDTIVIPMTMLSVFVFSAAVMGFLFLLEPLTLLIENRRKEAVIFFVKNVGYFACFVIIFGILLFLV